MRGQACDAAFVYQPEILDPHLAEAVHGIDLVMAGPPCQGHSNLNNRTRRVDRRNTLYLTVPAFAVACGARMAIIENVPEVELDDYRVVETALQLFESAGYAVSCGTLRADAMGWPQTRRRSFLTARRDTAPIPLADIADVLQDHEPRTLEWVIGDLVDLHSDEIMDRTSEMSAETGNESIGCSKTTNTTSQTPIDLSATGVARPTAPCTAGCTRTDPPLPLPRGS